MSRSGRRALERLWSVVADGGTARALGVAGDRRGLTVLREMASVDARRRTQDLVSDRQGRSFESGSATCHAIAPGHDPHGVARDRCVAQLATMLNEDSRARQFDDLILIVVPCWRAQTIRLQRQAARRARQRRPRPRARDHRQGPHQAATARDPRPPG